MSRKVMGLNTYKLFYFEESNNLKKMEDDFMKYMVSIMDNGNEEILT